MQSSALPLGHAADKRKFSSKLNAISQGKKSVLFLCNGHGEDLIAFSVMSQLHQLYPELPLEVLPLVGEGRVFEKSIVEGWVVKLGPCFNLPSGGFSNQSFRGLFIDLWFGLIFIVWNQWRTVQTSASKGRLIICIGDIFPLLLAWSSGRDFVFVGTPKSDYTWTSKPGFRLSDLYHRLKGSEWDSWELRLMRSRRCKLVAVRDRLTERGLKRHGVSACSPGNPMMDGFSSQSLPDKLTNYRRLILLPGSRIPEAYRNFESLLASAELIRESQPIAIFVALGSSSMLKTIESIMRALGFVEIVNPILDVESVSSWKKHSLVVFLGIAKFHLWAKWSEIGLSNAGTATEQLVGLGIPCVSLPGKGPQFNWSFASRQSRLLGGSVIPCANKKILALEVEALLCNPLDSFKRGINGAKRMGKPGASKSLAIMISKALFL